MKTTGRSWIRWVPLLALTATLAGCGAAVTEPAAAPTAPAPDAPQASCDDLAIRLLDHGAGVHGAIRADTLHMGGATAPATCTEPTNESLAAGLPAPEDRTEQAQQSRYYLIVIRYPGGDRLYIITRRSDGTSCVVDFNGECIAQVTDLPDDFDLKDLPDDVAPTIPAGRPTTPPAVSPPPPPAVSPPPGGGDTPPPATGAPRAAWFPDPRDGATNVDVNSSVRLLWEPGDSGGRGGPSPTSFDVYWGTAENLAADAALGTPIRTPTLFVYLERLVYETTYYWRVDSNNAAGTTRGNVWSFTTRTALATRTAPAKETPVVGAPAWPAAAADLKIEHVVVSDERRDEPPLLILPEPTGDPTPQVDIKGLMPIAVTYNPVYCLSEGCSEIVRVLEPSKFHAAKGTITLVASNDKGSAELEVPYNLTCQFTLAERLDRLRGSWVPSSIATGWSPGRYTALTIGDTITTVPASSGVVDRDMNAEHARAGINYRKHHTRGHTRCNEIYHPEWKLHTSRGTKQWNYGKHPVDQVGCERVIIILPRTGGTGSTAFVPAGCDDPPYGDPPYGDPPPAVSPPPSDDDTPPGAASGPQPRDGETGVASVILHVSWAAAPRARSYNVWWGAPRSTVSAADAHVHTPYTVSTPSATFANLPAGKTYYWRVDAINDAGTTEGPVWSFTTCATTSCPNSRRTTL